MVLGKRAPDRLSVWARMLAKAHAEGIQVRQLGSGMWITTSGSDADAAYAVNLQECECPGHAYHGYCKHRAALAAKLGFLQVVPRSERSSVNGLAVSRGSEARGTVPMAQPEDGRAAA